MPRQECLDCAGSPPCIVRLGRPRHHTDACDALLQLSPRAAQNSTCESVDARRRAAHPWATLSEPRRCDHKAPLLFQMSSRAIESGRVRLAPSHYSLPRGASSQLTLHLRPQIRTMRHKSHLQTQEVQGGCENEHTSAAPTPAYESAWMTAVYAGLGLKFASNSSGFEDALHESGSRTPQLVMPTHAGTARQALTTAT